MPARKSSPSRIGQLVAAIFTSIVAPVVVNYSVYKLKVESTSEAEPPKPAVVETVKLGPPVPQSVTPESAKPESEKLVWRPSR